MDSLVFRCGICDAVLTNVNIFTRSGFCPSCKDTMVLPREKINSAPQIVSDAETAVRAFEDRNFELAFKSATTVLESAYDNLPSKFIEAFHKAYLAPTKSRDLLDKFFNEILNGVESDPDERNAIKRLFLKCPSYVGEYENQILRYVSKEDPTSIATFMDAFCPITIAKKPDMDWLTDEMVAIYCDLSARVALPKTWYALFQHISLNPDSPEKTGAFYLKTKTKRYFETIVLGIEKIYSAIGNEQLKQKFLSALIKKKEIFISKM
ncbi:MAG: hypothetical protein E7352_04230 [Clostridiales bacterium]|nr:hypothetical protein [Clostridiales bacterium]